MTLSFPFFFVLIAQGDKMTAQSDKNFTILHGGGLEPSELTGILEIFTT